MILQERDGQVCLHLVQHQRRGQSKTNRHSGQKWGGGQKQAFAQGWGPQALQQSSPTEAEEGGEPEYSALKETTWSTSPQDLGWLTDWLCQQWGCILGRLAA